MIISSADKQAIYYRGFKTNLDFGLFEGIFPNIMTIDDINYLEEYFELFIKTHRRNAFK